MKIAIFIFLLINIVDVNAQNCATFILPVLSPELKKDYEQKLKSAEEDYLKDPTHVEAIIWYGRRTAYLGNYNEAIAIFTKGIGLHPEDARLYRHRGHRYITIRCFDKAEKDFKKAAKLIRGKKDEIEPDGLPNAQNIPTSTLQSNIWYHLGLVYYLKGEYKKGIHAYKEALKVSTNHDMYVATLNWLNLALQRIGKTAEAHKLMATIDPKWQLLESGDYLRILNLFQQGLPCKDREENESVNSLSSATYNFGSGVYCFIKENKKVAKEKWEKIISGNQWASFAYIAAEQELKSLK